MLRLTTPPKIIINGSIAASGTVSALSCRSLAVPWTDKRVAFPPLHIQTSRHFSANKLFDSIASQTAKNTAHSHSSLNDCLTPSEFAHLQATSPGLVKYLHQFDRIIQELEESLRRSKRLIKLHERVFLEENWPTLCYVVLQASLRVQKEKKLSELPTLEEYELTEVINLKEPFSRGKGTAEDLHLKLDVVRSISSCYHIIHGYPNRSDTMSTHTIQTLVSLQRDILLQYPNFERQTELEFVEAAFAQMMGYEVDFAHTKPNVWLRGYEEENRVDVEVGGERVKEE